MPTYEYECASCGYIFEVFQAMSDEPLKTCAKCGKDVRRLIFGGAGVIFKGSGFYVTDKGRPSGGKAPGTAAKTAESSGTAQNASTSEGPASPAAGEAKKADGAKPAAQTA